MYPGGVKGYCRFWQIRDLMGVYFYKRLTIVLLLLITITISRITSWVPSLCTQPAWASNHLYVSWLALTNKLKNPNIKITVILYHNYCTNGTHPGFPAWAPSLGTQPGHPAWAPSLGTQPGYPGGLSDTSHWCHTTITTIISMISYVRVLGAQLVQATILESLRNFCKNTNKNI